MMIFGLVLQVQLTIFGYVGLAFLYNVLDEVRTPLP